MRTIFIYSLFIFFTLNSCTQTRESSQNYIPVIDGEWWQVAGNPDLGDLTSEEQQPVDFGIWQAADGTWQIWSCIRKTKEIGNTRLFHCWEGKDLLDTNWEPKGIIQRADTTLGEAPGGMQAPYVIMKDNKYLMFYGDWNRICLSESIDGKNFTRVVKNGSPALFGDPVETNTRDAMVLNTNDQWYCYYTAHPNRDGKVFLRTSTDLAEWSSSEVVAYGGQAGKGELWFAECPFVIEYTPGNYFLLRTQSYLKSENSLPKTSIYNSDNPHNFGIDDDSYFIGALEVAAPEVFLYEGQWYIAALMPELDGIRIAHLKWQER